MQLRTTSLNASQLDAELIKRGARTSGSMSRKQERLDRFLAAEAAQSVIQRAVEAERRRVWERDQARAREIMRVHRVRTLVNNYLGW